MNPLIRILVLSIVMILPGRATAVPGDRWLEIDLYWFDRDKMQESVETFWDRNGPLFEEVEGWKGVILNTGWLLNYIADWQGDPEQQIPLPSNMKQWGLFHEQGPLTGTTDERRAVWKQRFPENRTFNNIVYQPWTYNDLKRLVELLKQAARERSRIPDFRVGTLVLAWDQAYDGPIASFAQAHPNVFIKGVWSAGVINLEAKLSEDPRKFAAYPEGIPEGTPFTAFFGRQWGALSRATGLDAIVLRDSFLGSGVYDREGLYGKMPPEDPEKIVRWTRAAADLVKQTKTANPKCLVIGYSNGASGVADLRVNCLDLEAIAREGFLDAYIDQTWAGAWNEVAQRPYTFWNSQHLGWTYQLAYVLAHSAVLAETKVRHYFLTETFDAWESWDIIHNAPERLRWGMWAFYHAAVKTPNGLKMPQGTYISWGNQGKSLLGREDVDFLVRNLNEAMTDAQQVKAVGGPTLVYNRAAMDWQSRNAPHQTIKEWVDEQAGTLMKWSTPTLSITRVEYLPQVQSDLFIFQTPSHLAAPDKRRIINLIQSGKPVMIVGSPAGGVDPDIGKLIGISTEDKTVGDMKCIGSLHHQIGGMFEGLPNTFPLYQPFTANTASEGLDVLYWVDGSPCLAFNRTDSKRVLFWDPPELEANTVASRLSSKESTSLDVLLGSPVPWVLTARALNSMARGAGQPYVEAIDASSPVFVAYWEDHEGRHRVLTGNLEEGIRHGADHSRQLVFRYPERWTGQSVDEIGEVWKGAKQVTATRSLHIFLDQGETKLFTLSRRE